MDLSPYDTLANGYDDMFVRPRDIAENEEIKRRLLRDGCFGGRVLDVGCGTGFLVDLAGIPSDSYVGIDISEEMLNRAKSKFPEHVFERRDMMGVPYPDASFDSVVALWSLSYAAAPAKAAAEMMRVLKPGGFLFLVVYSRWTPWFSPLPYELWPEYYGTRRTMFTSKALKGIFRNVGRKRVQGLSAKFVPGVLATRIMRLESFVVGNLLPGACTYLTMTGRKDA